MLAHLYGPIQFHRVGPTPLAAALEVAEFTVSGQGDDRGGRLVLVDTTCIQMSFENRPAVFQGQKIQIRLDLNKCLRAEVPSVTWGKLAEVVPVPIVSGADPRREVIETLQGKAAIETRQQGDMAIFTQILRVNPLLPDLATESVSVAQRQ